MRPIHVLHVVPTLKAGGMEMALARIANGLLAEGITHSVAVLKGDAIIAEQFDPRVRIHCLHARPYDWSVPLQLRRLIVAESPQLIHARNPGAWPEVALARLGVCPRVPLVFSFHGLADAKPLPWRWRVSMRLLARTSSHLFTVSRRSRQFLAGQVGLPAAAIAVIPNGVDGARFAPRSCAANAGTLVLGTLASLTPVKNQALLLRAGARLLRAGVDLRVDIAGEGPQRAALEELIRALGIGDSVRLLGLVADTPAFLRSLDVFVLPSASEAHPNALAEAMASGLACVASDVGGIREILDEGRAGLLFPAGDEDRLVDAMHKLVADPSLRRALGEAARDHVCREYAMAKMLARYRDLYFGLAGERRDGVPTLAPIDGA